jgi:hypothetical protein
MHWANHHRLKTDPKRLTKHNTEQGNRGGWFAYVAKEHSEVQPFRSLEAQGSVNFDDVLGATMAGAMNDDNSDNGDNTQALRHRSESDLLRGVRPLSRLASIRRNRCATMGASEPYDESSYEGGGSDMLKMLHMDPISTIHPGHREEREDLFDSTIADDSGVDTDELGGMQIIDEMPVGTGGTVDVVVGQHGSDVPLKVIP